MDRTPSRLRLAPPSGNTVRRRYRLAGPVRRPAPFEASLCQGGFVVHWPRPSDAPRASDDHAGVAMARYRAVHGVGPRLVDPERRRDGLPPIGMGNVQVLTVLGLVPPFGGAGPRRPFDDEIVIDGRGRELERDLLAGWNGELVGLEKRADRCRQPPPCSGARSCRSGLRGPRYRRPP